MKRDKTWLINEIEIMGSEESGNYPNRCMVYRESVLNLIDQLDEAEKEKLYSVIIPTKCEDWRYYYLEEFGGIEMTDDLKHVAYHTEAFIRSVSDDLWPFAVEVAE